MKYCILFISFLLLINCEKSEEKTKSLTQKKVLFVVSNQHTYGNSSMNASNHFGEIVYAYDVFVNNNFKVDFVSPKGGAIPIGYLQTSNKIQKKYVYDEAFMQQLKTTKSPKEIKTNEYNAVYYVGGGAAMFGVPEDIQIQKIASEIYKNNGVVSAICHGTAGIVNLKSEDGNYLFMNKKVNGFPDIFENKKALYYKTFPFSIQEIIQERGGNFTYSSKGWDSYYVKDGRLITGQDPTAAAAVAKEIINTLNTK